MRIEQRAHATRIEGPVRLVGSVRPPPDKSMTHRALILAALGCGTTRIRPLVQSEDVFATIDALRAVGVPIAIECVDGTLCALVTGVEGPEGFAPPRAPIDCKNSASTLRMMAGAVAGARGSFVFTGDASLQRRPMDALVALESMGAKVAGTLYKGRLVAPLRIDGGPLVGREHRLARASAQMKTALLLAGLFSKGRTSVWEPLRSRDHTERMLRSLGVTVDVSVDGSLSVEPIAAPWSVPEFSLPPDASSAATLLCAALMSGSDALDVESMMNPTRTGFIDVIRAMGANVHETRLESMSGEPVSRVSVSLEHGLLGIDVGGDLALRAIDELPLVGVVASAANGRTTIRDSAVLRDKESDRLHMTATLMRAFGAQIQEHDDGLVVEGQNGWRPRATDFDGSMDHRIFMAAVVLAMSAKGASEIRGAHIANVSFPGFIDTLKRCLCCSG